MARMHKPLLPESTHTIRQPPPPPHADGSHEATHEKLPAVMFTPFGQFTRHGSPRQFAALAFAAEPSSTRARAHDSYLITYKSRCNARALGRGEHAYTHYERQSARVRGGL